MSTISITNYSKLIPVIIAAGVLAFAAMFIAALLFIVYMLQCLLLSIRELCETFGTLDPTVRFLLILLIVVCVVWFISSVLKRWEYGK